MGKLHHVASEDCTSGTAQTAGMNRFAALSGDTVGSRSIWMGETHVAPGAKSGPHHHGDSETGIYIVSGTPEFIYSEDGHEVRLRTKPGDYIYVPPFVHHIESNAHSDEEAVVVIARSTQEAIVENLEAL
ncbi:MAG TPA: cupin domain-containing protein [Candidatus Dormibacteraeota bacterium]|nr:cupin domain-containing protein [Candidatus Dormibacteraeota bacterium]